MRFVFDSGPASDRCTRSPILKEWHDRVAANGDFSVEELREAANLDLSENELVGMRFNLLADDWNLSRASVVAHMDELLAAHAALKPTLLALATGIAPLIAELEGDPLVPDLAPVANAGGPYSGVHSGCERTISFNASASTSPSAIIAYEWDLDGDGAFDDATDVNPTSSFSTIRNTTIGLRVTNASGRRRRCVRPPGGNCRRKRRRDPRHASPRSGSARSSSARRTARLGETQAFSVTAPNANLLPLGAGPPRSRLAPGLPTYSLTPTAVQIGPHVLKVFVTAGIQRIVVDQLGRRRARARRRRRPLERERRLRRHRRGRPSARQRDHRQREGRRLRRRNSGRKPELDHRWRPTCS